MRNEIHVVVGFFSHVIHQRPDNQIEPTRRRSVASSLRGERANGPQGMVLRDALLRRHITEHRIRLAVVSSHARHGRARSIACRLLDFDFRDLSSRLRGSDPRWLRARSPVRSVGLAAQEDWHGTRN